VIRHGYVLEAGSTMWHPDTPEDIAGPAWVVVTLHESGRVDVDVQRLRWWHRVLAWAGRR
jgi:hypothetical protein